MLNPWWYLLIYLSLSFHGMSGGDWRRQIEQATVLSLTKSHHFAELQLTLTPASLLP